MFKRIDCIRIPINTISLYEKISGKKNYKKGANLGGNQSFRFEVNRLDKATLCLVA